MTEIAIIAICMSVCKNPPADMPMPDLPTCHTIEKFLNEREAKDSQIKYVCGYRFGPK
jgi:hypothetical protein